MTESNDMHEPQSRITPRLIESLYTEAMVLADEARAYFDDQGRDERLSLAPFVRVGFACESLKVTTRVMHIVAWLLTQRAVETGEITNPEGRRPERRLGKAIAIRGSSSSCPRVPRNLFTPASICMRASSDSTRAS
jgi:regulator of CtrA degradation